MNLTFEKFCEMYPLLEMPLVFPTEVNPEYINKYLMRHIKDGLATKSFIPTSTKNIFSYPKSTTESIYIMIDGMNLVGGASFKVVTQCNNAYVTPIITKKFIDGYPRVALDIYKVAYNNFKIPILTDSSQSVHSSEMWKKWVTNPTKYGIENVAILNSSNGTCSSEGYSLDDIWGIDKEHILVAIEFNYV